MNASILLECKTAINACDGAYSLLTSPHVLVLGMMIIMMLLMYKILMYCHHLCYPIPDSLPGF